MRTHLSYPSVARLSAGAAGLLAALTCLPFSASAGGSGAAPVLADISFHLDLGGPPPPPRHEAVIERDRPGPDYVWVNGYWDASSGQYVWVPGHWDRPPRRGYVWVAPRYERDHDGHYRMTRRGGWERHR